MYEQIFKRAIYIGVLLETIGIFKGDMVLAEVAVVSMCTTCLLMWIVGREEKKRREKRHYMIEKRKKEGE